mgnify:CR=1 FL=1|jgi:hypothetical protein|tara:strand:+ start:160 stop:351 length:192 start_codon:yes stop_codon:yes gene_type:complete
MSPIAPEDKSTISHITYITNRIHNFGDELYEDLMEREHDKAKEKAQDLIKALADLIQSLTDEI